MLLQGSLESSNVKPISEMANLVQVSRAYESAQKIIQMRDDLMDKTIRAMT
jgi:flagellar basal-body rod protein FlgF